MKTVDLSPYVGEPITMEIPEWTYLKFTINDKWLIAALRLSDMVRDSFEAIIIDEGLVIAHTAHRRLLHFREIFDSQTDRMLYVNTLKNNMASAMYHCMQDNFGSSEYLKSEFEAAYLRFQIAFEYPKGSLNNE